MLLDLCCNPNGKGNRRNLQRKRMVKQMAKIFLHATEITDKQLDKALQCLVDNGIDEDDAYEVLKALGYILLDEELFPDAM